MKKLVLAFILFGFLLINLVSANQLKVTDNHPFLINNSWIQASQLQVGDLLTTIDGKKARIIEIEDVEEKNPFLVYNLEDDIFHNYIASNIIVHNSNIKWISRFYDEGMGAARILEEPGLHFSLPPSVPKTSLNPRFGAAVEYLNFDSAYVALKSGARYVKIRGGLGRAKDFTEYVLTKENAACDTRPDVESYTSRMWTKYNEILARGRPRAEAEAWLAGQQEIIARFGVGDEVYSMNFGHGKVKVRFDIYPDITFPTAPSGSAELPHINIQIGKGLEAHVILN